MNRQGERRWTRRDAIAAWCAGVALVVGVAGTVISNDRNRPVASGGGVELEGERWMFTYVAAGEDGLGALAADGSIDLRGRKCRTTGRVVVGELPLNPSSAPSDVQAAIEILERSLGVGRITAESEPRVLLPDGQVTGPMPLLWWGSSEQRDLCEELRWTLSGLTGVRPIEGAGALDEAVVADDLEVGARRVLAEGSAVGAVPTRLELVVEADGYAVAVRRVVNGEPLNLVAQIRLRRHVGVGGGFGGGDG
jgi:hypothetical protein